MRPGHFARENSSKMKNFETKRMASMRPGHFARENSNPPGWPTKSWSFNEARAFRPGKPFQLCARVLADAASMRPGHFARENSGAADTIGVYRNKLQ